MSGKALFLDRDGTLIVDVHHGHHPDGVVLLPGVPEALRKAQALGYRFFLFTNQSGVGRGIFKLEDAVACNVRLVQMLGMGSNVFADICIAPEHPDDPPVYRKPSPRFILECITRHGLDPAQCYMVGDRKSDWDAGLNAGIQAVAVQSGKPIAAELRTYIAEKRIGYFVDFPAFVETLR